MQTILRVFDFLIYWAIILIPFSIAIAPALTYSFMGILLFSFLGKKIIRKEKLFINTPINIPMFFLILISLISFKNSPDLKSSLRGIGKLFEYTLIFLICSAEIKDKKHIFRIILAIISGAALASLDGLWQLAFGKDFIRGNAPILNIGLKRATAAFPNANVFGVYLSAIAPLIIGPALFYFKGKKRAAMLFISVLVGSGIAMTFSRGTALAFYLSILFLSIVRKNKVVTLFLIAIMLFSPFIAPENIKEWARQVDYNPARFMLNDDRISIYKNTVNMIEHHPFIGVGVATFSKNYLKYKLPEPENARTGDHMYAHNHFLQMAGEIGLIGLSIFFWLLYVLFREGFWLRRQIKDGYLGIVCLSLMACLFAFLINGLTETSLYYSRVAMIFWFLIGMLLSLKRVNYAAEASVG